MSRIEQSERMSLKRPKPPIKEVQRLKKKKKKKLLRQLVICIVLLVLCSVYI